MAIFGENIFNHLNPTIKIWILICCPIFISYRSSGKKLIKYQANSSCVIMSVILMTTLFYKALILQGEIWRWSLLGLKGLRKLVGKHFYHLVRILSKLHAFPTGGYWKNIYNRNLPFLDCVSLTSTPSCVYHCPSVLSTFTGSEVGVWGVTVSRSSKKN